jgi:hypothetical protein
MAVTSRRSHRRHVAQFEGRPRVNSGLSWPLVAVLLALGVAIVLGLLGLIAHST